MSDLFVLAVFVACIAATLGLMRLCIALMPTAAKKESRS